MEIKNEQMKTLVSLPPDISELIADYLLGIIDRAGMKSLLAWVHSSGDNQMLFSQFNDIWQASALTEDDNDDEIHREWLDVKARIHKKQNRKPERMDGTPRGHHSLTRIIGIAAAIIMIFGAGMFFRDKYHPDRTAVVEMVAPIGSRAFITLSDGSTVWLNAGTRLRYDNHFGEKNRDIQLEGEAYFKVARNENIPFVVNAANVKITALGTTFNVKAYSEEARVETSLESGMIKIEDASRPGENAIILRPNQKALFPAEKNIVPVAQADTGFQPDEDRIKVSEPVIVVEKMDDIRVSTSWKDDRWLIRGESMEALAVKLSRRYDITFVFKDDALRNYKFSATLRDETLEQVLNMIQVSAPIIYDIKEKTVYLSMNTNRKNTFERSTGR